MGAMPPDKKALARYGRELRALRDEAGLTQTALARRVSVSKSTISDIERGRTAPTPQLRTDLDAVLGSGRLERVWAELTGSGREAWKYEVAALVDGASAVYEYQVLVWPAHLQTEAYAHTLIRYGAQWLSEEERTARASERFKRATRMAQSLRPKLWVVLDETILLRRYGSPQIMRGQLAFVADLAERERITMQLVPLGASKHPGNSGAFKLITTDNAPDVLFAESAREGQLVTDTVEVAQFRGQFAALQAAATSPEVALSRLQDEIRRLDDEQAQVAQEQLQ